MRRKRKGTTGRRPSTFSQAKRNIQATGRNSARRGGARNKAPSVYARRATRQLPDTPERSRRASRKRKARNQLPDGVRHPGVLVRKKRATGRLPQRLVPLRRNNENASDNQTTRSVCTRKKASRRAVIIANGYGGRNGYKSYRPHSSCKT